jgi:hypothetical protein
MSSLFKKSYIIFLRTFFFSYCAAPFVELEKAGTSIIYMGAFIKMAFNFEKNDKILVKN